jgi:hypothetical protein
MLQKLPLKNDENSPETIFRIEENSSETVFEKRERSTEFFSPILEKI